MKGTWPDQLHGLTGVRCQAMFGGYGLYQADFFFGIIWRSGLLKTNQESRRKYTERGSLAFEPGPNQKLRTYYEVLVDVLEDRDRLAESSRQAVLASRGSARRRAVKNRR